MSRRGRRWGAAIAYARQTHCINGHNLENARIYIDREGRPHRQCRACNAIHSRKRQQARRDLGRQNSE